MKHEKRLERLLSKPKDYTFSEATTMLKSLGYELCSKGSTSGSRVMFYRSTDNHKILLHKPHPKEIMKMYMIDDLIEMLKEGGDIDG